MKQNPHLIGSIHDNADGDQWAEMPFIVAVVQINWISQAADDVKTGLEGIEYMNAATY